MVGNLAPGCEADWLLLNPAATPLLARKVVQANNLDELLFARFFITVKNVFEVIHYLEGATAIQPEFLHVVYQPGSCIHEPRAGFAGERDEFAGFAVDDAQVAAA